MSDELFPERESETSMPPTKPTEGIAANRRAHQRAQQASQKPPETPAYVPPKTALEAQQRYFAKWGPFLVDCFFGAMVDMPETVEAWVELAKATQGIVKARETARAQLVQRIDTLVDEDEVEP